MSNALIVHKVHLPRALLNVRAAQYVRMSTDRQQYSIHNQAAVIAAYAHAHNLTLVRTYKDEGAPRVTSNSSGCGQSNSSTREAGHDDC